MRPGRATNSTGATYHTRRKKQPAVSMPEGRTGGKREEQFMTARDHRADAMRSQAYRAMRERAETAERDVERLKAENTRDIMHYTHRGFQAGQKAERERDEALALLRDAEPYLRQSGWAGWAERAAGIAEALSAQYLPDASDAVVGAFEEHVDRAVLSVMAATRAETLREVEALYVPDGNPAVFLEKIAALREQEPHTP